MPRARAWMRTAARSCSLVGACAGREGSDSSSNEPHEDEAAEGDEEPAAEGDEEPAAEGDEEPAAEGDEEPAAEGEEDDTSPPLPSFSWVAPRKLEVSASAAHPALAAASHD